MHVEEVKKEQFLLDKYANRFYFVNEKNETDELGRAIDCWEQVLYQALRDYDVDYEFAFCDDINLIFTREKEAFLLEKESLLLNQSFFTVRDWGKKEDGIAVIENLVKDGKMVAVATMFDMLIPYFWYKECTEGSYNQHYNMIVGYDETCFYVVDSPDVLVKERDKLHPDNPTIHLIEKEQYRRAMDKYCEIKTIDVDCGRLSTMNKLDLLLPGMVKNFYEEKVTSTRNGMKYRGKMAILELIKAVECDQDYAKLVHVLRDFPFQCHLLFSRRLLLKWCLEKDETYGNSEYLPAVAQALEESIHHWMTLKYAIEKNNVKPISDFRTEIVKCFGEIVAVEERLFEEIEHMI